MALLSHRARRGLVLACAGVLLAGPQFSAAQTPSQTFPQTGHTVSGPFLTYWQSHGGLAQQGYPISDEQTEISPLDGKPYTVQYFERAVFEKHPENTPPYDILLSQLGTFRYGQKYPGGAPGQQANATNARLFPETGKHVGGAFRAYWETHGGLAQQGYPISEEFTEISPLDGKPYRVQYFERAVFEAHPDNAPPYDVLLSQLGTFAAQARQTPPAASPTTTTVPLPVPATATPVPAAADPYTCTTLPASHDMTVFPTCGQIDKDLFRFASQAFSPFEEIRIHIYDSAGKPISGEVVGRADAEGRYSTPAVQIRVGPGIWQVRMEGTLHQPYGYFQIIVPAPQTPHPKP
jgi:hypothetical protein